jgi:hypothetical protein
MTEEEWLASGDPIPMVRFLAQKASDRNLRLFLVASARLVWDRVPEGEMRDAVDVSERYADGLTAVEQINDYRGRFYRYFMPGAPPERTEWLRSRDNWPIFTLVRMTTYPDAMVQTLPGNENWRDEIRAYHPFLPPFLRDIFGNPFRPVTADLAWLTSTVVALARSIYDERAFDRLPILADALQDAGCDSADVLDHCRSDGPHVRGCWVVDLVLGKS